MFWQKYRHPIHFRPFFELTEPFDTDLDGWEYCCSIFDLKLPSNVASSPPSRMRRLTSIISNTFLNSLIPDLKWVK